MRTLAFVTLTARLSLKPESSHFSVKERVLTLYFQVVKLLLEMCVTDDIIAYMDREISWDMKPSSMLSLRFPNEVWLQTLRCPHVNYKYALKEIFVEEIPSVHKVHDAIILKLPQACPVTKLGVLRHGVKNLTSSSTPRVAAAQVQEPPTELE